MTGVSEERKKNPNSQSFRIRKFSRNERMSHRSSNSVNRDDVNDQELADMKKTLESDDDDDRVRQRRTISMVSEHTGRDVSEAKIQLMKVNVELTN